MPEPLGIPRDPDYSGPAGLDLANPVILDQCRRLVRSCPIYRRAVADGTADQMDLEQSILMALVLRQRTRSRYDRTRASLGRYVWLVARSVTLNELEKHHRRLSGVTLSADADAALGAAELPDLDPDPPIPTSAIDAVVYRITGGISPATATADQALTWRARAEDGAAVVLACRIAEGLYLLHQRELHGSRFSRWVSANHAGSGKTALDRVYVAWYATRVYRGSVDRLAAKPWRQLRDTARDAYVAHHGLGRRRQPKPPRNQRARVLRHAIAAGRRASASPHWAAARLLIPELDELWDYLAELDPGTP